MTGRLCVQQEEVILENILEFCIYGKSFFSPPFNMIFFKSVSSARSNLPQVIFSNVDIQQSDIQNV